jgi:hypothetical protein
MVDLGKPPLVQIKFKSLEKENLATARAYQMRLNLTEGMPRKFRLHLQKITIL